MSQAPDRHLEYFGGSRLVSVGSMERADDVVFFELGKIGL
jgi:hypothetical protein